MMKKVLLLLALKFSFLAGAVEITQPLLELLEVTGIEHQGTYESILQETQKKWLRPSGKERWEISDLEDKTNQQIFPLADQLGFVSEVVPHSNGYLYAALLGGTFGRMEKRLDFLIQLWNQGIRFKNLIFLTGQRPLDPTIEPVFEGCRDESEAAHYIWANHLVPEEMRNIPVQFVEVPMKEGKRPIRKDTYIAWLSTHPQPGSILLISNQPYCPFDQTIAVSSLPQSFSIETVGVAIDEKEKNGAVLLDSIARWIFAGCDK